MDPSQPSDFSNFMSWTLNILNGNPSPDFVYPPWTLFPLIPFALLPYQIARPLFLAVAIAFYGMTAKRLGASPIGVGAFMLSPLVFDSLAWGNVEWLALSGFLMPPAWGIIMFAIKPQLTIAVVIFCLVKTLKTRKPREIISLLLPVTFVLMASILGFGNWMLHTWSTAEVVDQTMNLSFFPYSIPVGVLLLSKAIQSQDVRLAIAASPMFSPWVTPQTWLVIPLALSDISLSNVVLSIGLWGYILWQRFAN